MHGHMDVKEEEKKVRFNIMYSPVLFVKNLLLPVSLLMQSYLNHESLYYFEGNK